MLLVEFAPFSEGIAPIGAICNAAISACAAQHLWQRALCLLDVAEGLPGGAEFWQILSDGSDGVFSGAGTKPVRCLQFQVNARGFLDRRRVCLLLATSRPFGVQLSKSAKLLPRTSLPIVLASRPVKDLWVFQCIL